MSHCAGESAIPRRDLREVYASQIAPYTEAVARVEVPDFRQWPAPRTRTRAEIGDDEWRDWEWIECTNLNDAEKRYVRGLPRYRPPTPAMRQASACPVAMPRPCPSEPLETSIAGSTGAWGWPWQGLPSLRSVTACSSPRKPCSTSGT